MMSRNWHFHGCHFFFTRDIFKTFKLLCYVFTVMQEHNRNGGISEEVEFDGTIIVSSADQDLR